MLSIPSCCPKAVISDPKEIFDGLNEYLDQQGYSSIQKEDLAHLIGKAYLRIGVDNKVYLHRFEPYFDFVMQDAHTFEVRLCKLFAMKEKWLASEL